MGSLLGVLLREDMKNEPDMQDGVAPLIDALAMLNSDIAAMQYELPVTAEWAALACKVINSAVAVILEQVTADRLQMQMIDLLQSLHARAIDERDAARREIEAVRGQQAA